MKIAVDMDEVMCSLHNLWFDIHNTRYVTNPKDKIHPNQIKDWGMTTVPFKCQLTEMMAILNEPGIFLSLPPKPGAVAAINKMIDAGHEVILVTACPFQHAMAEKIRWVSHFVPRLSDRIIGVPSSKAKLMVLGMFDVVIDDNPETLASIMGQPYKGTITRILIDAPYNEFAEFPEEYDYRVMSLEAAAALLDGLSERETSASDHILKCFRCMSNMGVLFNDKTQEVTCSCCNMTAHRAKWDSAQAIERKLRTLSLVELGNTLSEANKAIESLVATELNGNPLIYLHKNGEMQ